MSTLSLRLPNSVHLHAKRMAEQEGVSVNQFISLAVAEKLSALKMEKLLTERAARGNEAMFRKVLAKVPAVDPVPGDELP